MSQLDRVIKRFEKLPPEVLKEIDALLDEELGHLPWVPTEGPQLEAYRSPADEVFYGGSAGGGKSSFGIGLALTEHQRSLILRRFHDDAEDLAEQMLELLGSREGYNGQKLRLRTPDGRLIRFGGCKEERDKQRYKGDSGASDLMVFDELPDFLESQYLFIKTWNRSPDPEQRVRVVATGNPPTSAEGLWVIKRWAPWLDRRHPNPAKSGELRWFISDEEGNDKEVEGPGRYDVGGRMVKAKSRTFIRARLEDNPDLTQTDDYQATLDGLPAELRAAYRDGKFDASLKEDPWQVIPTDWILQAQQRWTKNPPPGIPQCALGVDGSRTTDDGAIAPRYDGWYAPIITVKPGETPHGSELAGVIITHRRENAIPVIDVIESVGAQAYAHLKDQGIRCHPYRGNDSSSKRNKENTLGFFNKRSASYWAFREALDPHQEGGSPIMLPDDAELTSDLAAPTWKLSSHGIQIESKESVVKRLGRSPNKGDAVIMAWVDGAKMPTHYGEWQTRGPGGRKPRVNLGRMGARRR